MKIKKISLENIRSYKNHEIEFPEGSVLLSGDIGSGKTSILLGIEFALFGLQPGQRGHSLLRNEAKEGKVKMEFDVDGKEVIVERNLKRTKTVSQDKCSITVEGVKKDISVSELKNKILEILDYPREFAKKQNLLYRFTVYTPQEEMKQIILQDSETRINTLRHVFGIDRYKRILENASIVASKLREEKRIKEVLTLNFEQHKSDIINKERELEQKRKDLSLVEGDFSIKVEKRKKIEKEKQEILKKIGEKSAFQQEIEKTKIMMLTKRDLIFSNDKFLEQIKNQISELQKLSFDDSKINLLEQQVLLDKKEKEKLSREDLELNSQIKSLNLKNEEGKNLIQKISSLEVCPTCLQDVDAVYRANVLNRNHNEISKNNKLIEELDAQRKEMLGKILKIDNDISSSEKQIQEFKILKIKLQEISVKQKQLEEISVSQISLKKDIELLTQHISLLKKSVEELEKTDLLFETKQKEFEESLRQERLAEVKFAELKKEIEFFSRQIEELKEQIRKANEIMNQLKYITELENWISKKFIPLISIVEKNVMTKLKSEFSKLFEEWFSMLVSDSFDVRLSDDFTPVIEHQDYEIDYAYLSGGERTAVALAYRLSLNQVINSLLSKIKTREIVILDEPTDGFSEQQLDKMRDVLQQLNVKQLIIVSHEQKIESFVENVIRLKKENGVSRIEE
ncbi:MAG: AAA family ATPase [archaeon]